MATPNAGLCFFIYRAESPCVCVACNMDLCLFFENIRVWESSLESQELVIKSFSYPSKAGFFFWSLLLSPQTIQAPWETLLKEREQLFRSKARDRGRGNLKERTKGCYSKHSNSKHAVTYGWCQLACCHTSVTKPHALTFSVSFKFVYFLLI